MHLTRRGRAVLALLAAGTLTGATTAALTLPGEPAPGPLAATPSPAPSPSPPPPARGALLPAVPGTAPVPAAPPLAAAVAVALRDPGIAGRLAVSVVDVASGRPVYERRADALVLPASTAKIAAAVAVLTAVPPATRLSTRVVAGSRPGEVVLVGGGDPTLAGPRAEPRYPAPARLTDLARRTRAALGTTRVSRVLVDESLYSGPRVAPGWKPGYLTEGAVAAVGPLMVDAGRIAPGRAARHGDPALAAGRALAALLRPGARVPVARGTAGPDAPLLAEVRSPPVAQLVERMLLRSDNDLAEALTRQVALARGQPASFGGAAAAVSEVLAGPLQQAGAAPGAVRLADGSGLSRNDRLQPGALTRLLAVAAAEGSPLAALLSGLPVAGFDGTLSRRYRRGPGAPAAGAVRAKTGTLNGVSALAGLVRTADGRLLAFDFTADGVPIGGTRRAEAALDALAARIATCGCR